MNALINYLLTFFIPETPALRLLQPVFYSTSSFQQFLQQGLFVHPLYIFLFRLTVMMYFSEEMQWLCVDCCKVVRSSVSFGATITMMHKQSCLSSTQPAVMTKWIKLELSCMTHLLTQILPACHVFCLPTVKTRSVLELNSRSLCIVVKYHCSLICLISLYCSVATLLSSQELYYLSVFKMLLNTNVP